LIRILNHLSERVKKEDDEAPRLMIGRQFVDIGHTYAVQKVEVNGKK